MTAPHIALDSEFHHVQALKNIRKSSIVRDILGDALEAYQVQSKVEKRSSTC